MFDGICFIVRVPKTFRDFLKANEFIKNSNKMLNIFQHKIWKQCEEMEINWDFVCYPQSHKLYFRLFLKSSR